MQTIDLSVLAELSDVGNERAILACLMSDPQKIVDCALRLQEEDFTDSKNQYLYKSMLSVYSRGGDFKFDLTSLMTKGVNTISEVEFFEKAGGQSYLEYLEIIRNSMVDLSMFGSYVEVVAEFANKRKLHSRLSDIQRKTISDPKLKTEELIVHGQEHLNKLLFNTASKDSYVNLGSKSAALIESTTDQTRETIGINTLYPKLDKAIEGLQRKNLIIICAETKTGKSTFLTNVAVNVGVIQKIPVLYIDTEMSDEEVIFRSLAKLSRVQEVKIKKNNLDPEESVALYNAQEKLRTGKFMHLFMINFTVEKIVSSIRKFVHDIVGRDEKGKVNDCLVIFDYIKMPQTGISFSAEAKEYKVLGAIADSLKAIAGELDISVMAACQTNQHGGTANSFELEWFCNLFAVLKKKSQTQMDNEASGGGMQGNQSLFIKRSRGGADNQSINFNFVGNILTYTEI